MIYSRAIRALARAAGPAVAVVLAAALTPGSARGQGGGAAPTQTPAAAPTQRPARPEIVEIRAQAPVPQVVTVRPRVLPTFRADVLDTTFIDRGFKSALLTPYSIVPPPLPSPSPGAATPVAPAPAASSPLQHAPPQER